jgi:hypothetical protein
MSGKASYRKRQEGNETIFETVPAPTPKWWFILILGLLMAVAAVNTGLGGMLGLIMWGIVALAVWAFFKDPRPKDHRRPVKLRVSAGQLVTNSGKVFRDTDIKDIALQNLYSSSADGSGTRVSIGGAGGDLGAKRKDKLRAVSWYLQLGGTAGQSYHIASGLDHDTAANLLREIGEVLGKQASAA